MGIKVSEKNISMCPRDWFCNILMKNVAAFYPHPNYLPEAKGKSFGLIPLAGKKSQTSLVFTLVCRY